MVLVDLLVFLAVLLAVYNFIRWRASRHLRLPPGPPSIPFLGNFNVFMGNRPIYKVLKELADKYGSVFSLKLPMGRFVILSEVDVIREAFLHHSEDFSGRPYVYSVSLMTRNNCGIAFSDYSPSWRLHRRAVALAIRRNMKGYNCCMPTSAKIVQEVEQLNNLLSKKDGMYCDISMELNLAVLNVICDMTFGQRYEITDTDYQQMLDSNNKFAAVLEPGAPIDIIPALKIFPNKKLRMVQEIIQTRDSILQKKYDEHFRTFDPNNIRDLTDAFIASMLECNGGEDNECTLTEDHVVMAMWELFVGGYEATYKTLLWALIYVLNNPEVQAKIQDELACIGNRLPVWDDHLRLPYLEATVMETLRRSSFSSLNGPRRTTCDTKVQGLDIPKDTTVFCNLWWVHHNPKHWKDPFNFQPERFLDKDGKVFTPKSFMAFSVGRRICLGENLAKMELFMFLGGILKRFHLKTPAGEQLPDTEPQPDMMRSPNFFRVQIVGR